MLCRLLALLLPLGLCAAAYTDADFANGRKLLDEWKKTERTPVLARPRAFVRTQTKYSAMLYRSCYEFTDRPLFANRKLFDVSKSDHKIPSVRKTLELYNLSGLDGICTFAWPGAHELERSMKVYYAALDAEKNDPAKFNIFFEVSPSYFIDDAKMAEMLKNPHTFRVGGKILISSYVMDSMPPEKLKKYVEDLRRRSGDGVLFLPQMHFLSLKGASGGQMSFYDIYRKHGTLPAPLLEKMRDYLIDYLEICDGLYLTSKYILPDGSIDESFNRDVMIPVFKSALSRKPYNGRKLFAVETKVGYTAYYGAQTISRDGTRSLRKTLNDFSTSGADLMIGTEWDELNEDTGFQPLVGKPMSSQRIMRSFFAAMKGEKPTMLPGDDPSVPNLIVSFRRCIVPGMLWKLELLNVPDNSAPKHYSVRAELLDENDRVLCATPSYRFDGDRLQEHTFELDSMKIADARTIRPRLTVTGYGDKELCFMDGLPFTSLRSSTGDQEYSCTPLRNLLKMDRAECRIDGNLVSCDFAAGSEIAALEVLQDNLELYAHDPHDELLTLDPERVLVRFKKLAHNPPPRLMADFDFKVDNAPSLVVFTPGADPRKPAERSGSFQSERNVRCDWWDKPLCFSIRKSELADAVFTVNATRRSGPKNGEKLQWSVPLGKLLTSRVVATVSGDGVAFALELNARPWLRPLEFGVKTAKFQREIPFDNPSGVAALRVVSADGKVYWSRPFVRKGPEKGRRTLFAYSDTAGKHLPVELAADRVPVLNYRLDPADGNILWPDGAAREFAGMAGSFLPIATNFQGLEGNVVPYNALYSRLANKNNVNIRPEWAVENGSNVLRFDGKSGNVIIFASSMIPQRAGFTVSMEVRVESLKQVQTLFKNGVTIAGSLELNIRSGKLEAIFHRRTPNRDDLPSYSVVRFLSNVPVEVGKYQTITFTYDGATMSISNGTVTESKKMGGVGLYCQYSLFGGTNDRVSQAFHGTLRALSVSHTVKK